jgi:hypothetical protein
MSTTQRSAFFFPHQLTPDKGPPKPPGRVPFDVEAELSDGNTVWTDEAVIVVSAR